MRTYILFHFYSVHRRLIQILISAHIGCNWYFNNQFQAQWHDLTPCYPVFNKLPNGLTKPKPTGNCDFWETRSFLHLVESRVFIQKHFQSWNISMTFWEDRYNANNTFLIINGDNFKIQFQCEETLQVYREFFLQDVFSTERYLHFSHPIKV